MNNNGKKGPAFRLNGSLRFFVMWPVYVGILQVILTIVLYFINPVCSAIMAGFSLICIIFYLVMYLTSKPVIMHDLIDFSSGYSQIQHKLMHELSVPYALLDNNGKVMWMNYAMQEITGKGKDYRRSLSYLIPEISPSIFPENEQSKQINITFNNRDYRVELKSVNVSELTEISLENKESAADSSFLVMYMFDITDINMYIQKIKDERFVAGLIYIDNYEEALETVDDVKRSLFVGLIDKRVNKYFSSGAAIIRKLEKDKYLAVFRYKYLEKLMSDKFSILEDIKNIKIGNDISITLSIAIGTGGNDYAKNYEVAKSAMELALGRGGDQAVVKDGENTIYFGGKSQQMEKNTRVKVRVKAHALRQILDNTQDVFIMGHKLADIDSFGAAIGMYVICRKLGRNARIVLEDVTSSIKPFVDRFLNKDEYPEDIFLTREQAMEFADESSAVIVVDVNIPARTECPELLDICNKKMVFDHHRQSSEPITCAVLSYVDPYASSACEMITEMIQYIDDDVKIRAFEADALYAGITIDTDGFNSKSSPRTFEAAAFLRRHGADVTRVRKMLRNDMNEYRAIAMAVSQANVYKNCFAITKFESNDVSSPTIGGAKAANQLLDISGIKASFVVTPFDGEIYVSARSIDEVNVQRIMEKLGGGGHMTMAGAQLKECTADQAIHKIKLILDDMLQEGEI